MTEQLIEVVCQEILQGQSTVLCSHALVQATAKDYIRRSQERLIAAPLLERLVAACGGAKGAEQRLLDQLETWRGQSPVEQGYGSGNGVNLLRLLRSERPNIHEPAYEALKILSGRDYADRDYAAWDAWAVSRPATTAAGPAPL